MIFAKRLAEAKVLKKAEKAQVPEKKIRKVHTIHIDNGELWIVCKILIYHICMFRGSRQ